MRLPEWSPQLLRRAGLAVTPPGPAGPGLLQPANRPALRSRALGQGAWLVETKGPGRRRRIVRLGEGEDETFLITPGRRPPRHGQMHRREMALAKHLGEEHIAWVLRRLQINCVIDVGGNKGQYGEKLRRAGYRGRIASFEPVPRYAEQLQRKAADDPDWTLYPFALGREDSTSDIYVSGSFSSLLDSSDFGKEWRDNLRNPEHRGHQGVEQITVRRLDDLYDEVVAGLDEPRVYLKLDTQGYDLEAFAGAGRRIDSVLGMQSEVSMTPIYEGMPRFPEQLATYEAAGFEATGIFPVIRQVPTMRMLEFDLVMVRPEAARVG